MVLFDLPVVTASQRKAYTHFHKKLVKDGFTMWQYSVYVRHCASEENGSVHVRRVEDMLPTQGKVSILTITEKQMSAIRTYWGRSHAPPDNAPMQLEIF